MTTRGVPEMRSLDQVETVSDEVSRVEGFESPPPAHLHP